MAQSTLPRGISILKRMEGQSVSDLEAKLAAWPVDAFGSEAHVDCLAELGEACLLANPTRSIEAAQEALVLAESLGYREGKALAQAVLGYGHYMLSQHQDALGYIFSALTYFEETEDYYLVGMLKSGLASVETSLGNYAAALAHGLEALKLARQYGEAYEEAWVLHGIGLGYCEVGDYATSLEYLDESLAVFMSLGEKIGEARSRTLIGTVLQHLERYQQALPFHEKSLRLFQETENQLGIARALNDLGTAYHAIGRYAQSAECHKESLVLREAYGNRQAVTTSLINLGKLYTDEGNIDQALSYLKRALETAEALEIKPRMHQAHHALATAYERIGDYERALTHFKAFHDIHEQVLGDETNTRLKTLEVQHEVSQAEREAALERQQRELVEEKNVALETLLGELKATQAQLVQTEKMASLGQLTAGIAHEIKNPLNFINNFAALSIELTEELEEYLDEDVQADIQDVVADLCFNAKKIVHHGKRADRIVRGMMLHARGKPGEHQSIDLNALLDEYIGLAYHGMRARRPLFNMSIEKDFDASVEQIKGVSQELGRVFLNLLGNAFDAVHERASTSGETFVAKVAVRSRRLDGSVEVRIEDNGGGIPETIQASIFEPFFTTKPTGQGTGLGLSLSYDIITQGHGGALRVESEEGIGAVFIVTLPV